VRSDVAILGGGVAGLSLADALGARGRRACLIEAQPRFGGLVRTIEVGGQLFDTGPHGIYAPDERLRAWFHGLMGEALRPVERRSDTLFRGRRVPYPLTVTGALQAVRLHEAARVAVEAGLGRALRGAPPAGASFERWAIHSFGRTLYRLFFEGYTAKVWGVPGSALSAEWISAHLPANSLLHVLYRRWRDRNLPIGYVSRFYYSARGAGHLVARLEERVRTRASVDLLCSARARRIARNRAGWRLEIDGPAPAERHTDEVVCAAPVRALLEALDPPPPPDILEAARALRFRNLILVFLVVARPQVSDANWLYVPDPTRRVARIAEYKNMIASMRGRPDTSLGLEMFCWPEDALWRAPDEELVATAVADAEALGLVVGHEVTAAAVVRLSHAYPVFDLDFPRRMATIRAYLASLGGIHLLGRTGGFAYLDQAGCVREALDWAERRYP
jgi:protoporphyrinogen oxidase